MENWPWWSQDFSPLLAASLDMTGEEGGGHSGLYHTSSQVLLARLYDNVLTNLHPAGLRQKACVNCGQLADSRSSHTESSDDNAEERSEFSDSDLSSTSTDITVRLTRNFSSHNISKVKCWRRFLGLGCDVEKHFRNLRQKQELCSTPDLSQVCHSDRGLEIMSN